MLMRYEWDNKKRERNLATHGVDFTEVNGFDWTEARIRLDVRKDYGELRMIAYGPIGDRLYQLVFTLRAHGVRIISLRKANRREVRRYVEDKGHHAH
jgi:hypothetical protein